MSEYQYYEFRAIDRPLDERAMAALRSITSRARITPTSLVNVYHFGDFKGDPDRLLDQYFDAHLYVANRGTRRLMLRWPARSFPLASAKPEEYDRPVTLLKDLHDLGERSGDREFVAARIRQLRTQHGGKRTLIQRLDRAGLPQ